MRRFHLLLIMLCVALGLFLLPSGGRLFGATPAEEPSLTALLADYRSVSPATEGHRVHERTVRLGHLDFYFEDGSLFPLRSSGGTTLGLFFRGRGRYTYHAADSGDRQALAESLSHRTVAPGLQNSAVSDALDQVIIFFATPVFQELWTANGGETAISAPAAAPAVAVSLGPQDRSAFEILWKRIQKTYLPYDHLATEARLNGGHAQYVYAEIEGRLKTIGYTYDRMRSFEERLCFFREISKLDFRLEDPVSIQRIERGTEARTPDLVMKDAQIQVLTEDNRHVRIMSDLTLQVGKDGLRVAHLDLLNNRSPYTYDWASDRNQLRIRRVTDETGQNLPYSHRYHQVLVQLRQAFSGGDFVNLRFETEGNILTGVEGKTYDNYFELMDDPWYPQVPFWGSNGFLFTLKVKTHKPYFPVASGATTSLKEVGDSYELESTSDRPSRIIALFAGKYATREEKFNGRTVRVYAYSAGREVVLGKLPRLANSFLTFYERNLGPYPGTELDILEIPKYGFGIAPSGMVLLTSEAFNPYQFVPAAEAYRRFLGSEGTVNVSRGINHILAHEIAHQWFLHKAMPASPRDVWLSESFAEYLSGLAMAAAQTDEATVEGFSSLFAEWHFFARNCRDAGPLESADMYGNTAAITRYCLLYNRGPLVLHMLRTMTGDDRFFEILRRFLDHAHMGPVTTDDFRTAVEEVVQADMGWFFDSWFRQGGIPEIHTEHRIETTRDGMTLVARATQADGPNFRKILIPFVAEYADGRREVQLLFQDKPVVEARFPLSGKPKKVSVDPGQNNLAVYR